MFAMRFEGGEELARTFDQLSVGVTKRVWQGALYEGGEPIRKRGASNAPHAPGAPDIRANIVMSTVRASRYDAAAALAIGPARGFAYGLPNEIGTFRQPARPFMRPAFDSEAPKALPIIGQALWRELAARGIQRSATVNGGVSGPDAFTDSGAGLGAGNRQSTPRSRR